MKLSTTTDPQDRSSSWKSKSRQISRNNWQTLMASRTHPTTAERTRVVIPLQKQDIVGQLSSWKGVEVQHM